ncbi:MAG: hypothetical protein JW939_05625, partial [Candidatus Thermoplasmatota archaeon]|nr:hypothetical protein [Candidatus Thermoplasmatota archaeon]
MPGSPVEMVRKKGILIAVALLLIAASMQTMVPGTSCNDGKEQGVHIPNEECTRSDTAAEPIPEHYFTENRGQWVPEIEFVARTDFGRMAITGTGMIYDIREIIAGDLRMPNEGSNDHMTGTFIEGYVIAATFKGGSSTDVVGIGALPMRSNYFTGGDEEEYTTNIPSFREVVMEDIYDGIDARFYFNGDSVKYDLLLAPDADPDEIIVRIDGADALDVGRSEVGFILDGRKRMGDSELLVYCSDNGEMIDASFCCIGENSYGFDIVDRPLGKMVVIDPVIRSAFISGGGQDKVEEVIMGPDGSHYIGGVTDSLDFPVTPGAYQVEIDNSSGCPGNDIFITKLNSEMNDIIFSTFMGGCDHEWLTGMELLEDGSIVFAGYTLSEDFPNTTGAMDNTLDGFQDGFVARLSADGSELVYSSYFGGNDLDWIGSMSVDDLGRTYLVGWSFSTDLPRTGGARNSSEGPYMMFITVVENDGSSVLRSMIFNSSDQQEANGIVHLENGNVLLSGFTYNRSFPVTPGCIDTCINGTPGIDADIFLMEIDIWDHETVRSGVIGGSVYERPYEVEVDGERIWMAGITTSPDLPLTEDAFRRPASVDSVEWFIMRVDRNITTLEYSTYISGDRDEWDINMEVGDDGLLYICGKTWSSNIIMTEDAFDSIFNGSTDLAIMVFEGPNMSLVHSTYLGGEAGDYVSSMIYAGNGTVAIGGYAVGDFPQGREHYLNHSTSMPGFIVYYSLPIPPGPP